jgi:hypothetical protein
MYSQLSFILEVVPPIRILGWKAEGKGTLGRPTRRWEDNIKTDLKEEG